MSDDSPTSVPPRTRNVMLVGDPESVASREVYERWLTDTRSDTTHVVVLTYLRRPETYLERWEAVADRPAEFVVVDARDRRGETATDDLRVVTAAPNDLTRLGIHVSEFLDGCDGDVTFLFDSLSALLQFVDVETAYRFVHVLTSRMNAVDARAFYALNPGQHDAQTTSIFTQLADASLTHDRDAETWSLSTR